MNLNLGEILVAALTGPLEVVSTIKLGELFDKLHDHDAEGHAATVKSLYIGIGQLERLTDETKTKIDDAVVNALQAAIVASAEKYDIELPA